MSVSTFRPEFAAAFAALNREWIERLFVLEDADRKTLDDPVGTIIAPGGEIFFAIDDGQPVGTVAMVPTAESEFELAKMAVTPAYQGQGIGMALGEAAIAWARQREVRRVFLLTSSRLTGAIRLYQRLGFRHCPLPADNAYARGDVCMEILL